MPDRYDRRRAALFAELPEVDSLVLTPGSTLRYLSGYVFDRGAHGPESPFLLVCTRDGDAAAVLPDLETDRASETLDADFYTYEGHEDAAREAFAVLAADHDLGDVAVEYRTMRLNDREVCADVVDVADAVDLAPAVDDLRATKDEAEVDALRRAAEITDEALEAGVQAIEAGVTEREIEAAIKHAVLDSDADDYAIGVVTSGPRTYVNYTSSTDRAIQDGEPVLIDTGVVYDGYYADVTRTVALGEPGEEFRAMYEAVREANAAARAALEPGQTAGDLDAVSRDVIEAHGYGGAYLHGLGHGIGLEAHEQPYLDPDGDAVLEAGNAFTVEPGVYVEGVGGVRIEDEAVLTASAGEVLTGLPRELRVL